MTRLDLQHDGGEGQDEMDTTTEPYESSVLRALGSFLKTHGLATLLALVFVWFLIDDRRAGASAAATQMKDLNGQILHVTTLLQEHHVQAQKGSEQVTRILTAQCLNLSKNDDQRERCLGLR